MGVEVTDGVNTLGSRTGLDIMLGIMEKLEPADKQITPCIEVYQTGMAVIWNGKENAYVFSCDNVGWDINDRISAVEVSDETHNIRVARLGTREYTPCLVEKEVSYASLDSVIDLLKQSEEKFVTNGKPGIDLEIRNPIISLKFCDSGRPYTFDKAENIRLDLLYTTTFAEDVGRMIKFFHVLKEYEVDMRVLLGSYSKALNK
ncbi:MAG: hypothetical protein WC307_00750 [Candidatus Nanoarchaeia archaeon]|jgi:hypothetical protein